LSPGSSSDWPSDSRPAPQGSPNRWAAAATASITPWPRASSPPFKKELIHGRPWPTKAELRTEVFEYIEVFFNRRRRHSTLGMLSPANYQNSTLNDPGPGLAASRPASIHNIKFTAPTINAIA
jgi:transposase InsO family protein